MKRNNKRSSSSSSSSSSRCRSSTSKTSLREHHNQYFSCNIKQSGKNEPHFSAWPPSLLPSLSSFLPLRGSPPSSLVLYWSRPVSSCLPRAAVGKSDEEEMRGILSSFICHSYCNCIKRGGGIMIQREGMSVCLSICLSVYLSVYLSVCLCLHLFSFLRRVGREGSHTVLFIDFSFFFFYSYSLNTKGILTRTSFDIKSVKLDIIFYFLTWKCMYEWSSVAESGIN